ncbi:MAG: LysM peptidoglycan-binding domain-containing protein [Proteobacteria bacterium]|nr:LysM peptidoglycan-binding domain-containing protein [Pseudomonadota bacterium]
MKPVRFMVGLIVVTGLILGTMTFVLAAPEHQSYTVKPGDTLWGISKRFYNDESLWPKLWELNRNRTTNPHQIAVGDVLIIFPLDELMKAQAPPAPPPAPESLYRRGELFSDRFPRYFTYLADPDGIGGTGVNRITVKRIDPDTRKMIVSYDEVREVGEIVASLERGYRPEGESLTEGKLILSFYDDVIIRFTVDLAKVLDSATHEDMDPYFREFPVYGYGEDVKEPDDDRHDKDRILGRLHQYKGNVQIVSRVETMTPMTMEQKKRLIQKTGRNLDSEPVSYLARIVYSAQPINIGDRIFIFKSLYPGPDRELDGGGR